MRKFSGRRRGALGAAALAAVLAALPLPAQAEVQHLYVMSGTGGGLAVVFNRAGLIALAPLVNVAFPRVQTRIDSTPTSTARGTPADPGVAAGASAIGPVLGLPPGLAPSYPLFADASYPTGVPSAETGDAQDVEGQGGSRLAYGRAQATAESARAEAYFGGGEAAPASPASSGGASLPASLEGRAWLRSLNAQVAGVMKGSGLRPVMPTEDDSGVLVRIGGGTAASDSIRNGERVAGFAESRAFGVVLLGGLITIDSVFSRTSVDIPRPGATPVVDLKSTVSGVSVLGMEGRFGSGGLELPGASVPVQEAVLGVLNQAFAERGGRFSVGKVQSGDDVAGVAALAFDFDGSLTPVVPRVLGPESDTARVGIGATVLRYSSVRVGEDDDALFGGSEETGADSSPVSGVQPSAAAAGVTAGGTPDPAGGVTPGLDSNRTGADALAATPPGSFDYAPEASFADLFDTTGGYQPGDGQSGTAALLPATAVDPGVSVASDEPVALAANARGRAALINDTSNRVTTFMTLLAWAGVLWFGLLLRLRLARR